MKLHHLVPKCFSAFLFLNNSRKRILFSGAIAISLISIQLNGQSNAPKITATGTGNTTGHIATLTVKNTGPTPIHVNPQIVYIPSGGEYQPYVAGIPATNLSPRETTTIPVNGYCVDVNTPPVPNGDPMPPIDSWIPVGDPDATVPQRTVNVVPATPIPPFNPEDIPATTNSPGYTPIAPSPDADIIITWPGTDIPVEGTLDPLTDPKTFAPVIVKVVNAIEEGTDVIQHGGVFPTPFSPDPPKERESIIQHVIWIYTSALSGKEYTKDVFASNVRNQFHYGPGTTDASLPEDQQKKVDEGIDAFWETFTAVGVEAKVLSKAGVNKQ